MTNDPIAESIANQIAMNEDSLISNDVLPFRQMGDRSGDGTTRQARRSEDRKEQKRRESVMQKMREIAPSIADNADLSDDEKMEAFQQFVRFHEPITRGEVQEIIMSTLGMYDKLAGEVKKLFTTNQALLRLLVNSDVISREAFEAQAKQQIEWNSFVNQIIRAIGTVPLRDLVNQVRQWNDNPANVLKVEPHHIDLSKHLLDEEGMTLEEKILVAQELSMPEALVQALRDKEYQRYNPPALSEAEASPEAVESDEAQP